MSLRLFNKKTFGYVAAGTWSALGFSRGMAQYDRDYTAPYMYTRRICSGLFAVVVYLNPFFVPAVFLKEMYRIEVNLRDLPDEKKKPDYYQIM